ncbi:MAG: hypothetical protein EA361_00620 [Bacteroidetes bacterium]|nr:MAG: hypothetical protein EA361_00620 [Bacteroidota bacterium]
MKNPTLFLFVVVICSLPLKAQEESKPEPSHQIGLQANPFFNELFFDELASGSFSRSLLVFSARYGQQLPVNKKFTVGGEFTWWQTTSRDDMGYLNLNLGPWARYSLYSFGGIHFFTESSVYATYYNNKVSIFGEMETIDGFDWGYYVAPGINFKSSESRWSLDLLWKFSTEPLIDNRRNVFSFKINYHF